MMDVALTILVSCISSTGFFAFLQFLISRKDKKADQLIGIDEKLDKIASKCDRNELATTRLQLLWMVKSQPKNHDTIIKTATRYFIDLDGDGEAWDEFDKWARQEGVTTGWYSNIAKKENNKERSHNDYNQSK